MDEEKRQNMVDSSTGTPLFPSINGEKCLGSGEKSGYECCCDECDFYLECFPDWDKSSINPV